MNLINQHIRKNLLPLENENNASFQEVFELIQNDKKNNLRPLLVYVDLILNETFSEGKSKDKAILHLHFEYNFDNDSLLIISQYLLIKLFKENSTTNISHFQADEKLILIKKNLQNKKNKLAICPDSASGKNGGNRIYKNWIVDKKHTESLISFYNKLNNNTKINYKTLFNCQVGLSSELNKLFITRPYASEVESHNDYLTFNLLNTRLTLNNIDEIDSSIIDNLDTIILFDCEKRKMMQYFSLKEIVDYNINFKKYLIVTFGNKKISIQSLRNKISLTQEKLKISSINSYPIIQSEIEYSLGIDSKKYIPVSFIGIETSNFWDAFVYEANIQDLYELRSIKMMNLYSLCLNEEIKEYILEELFSGKDTSDLISDETKQGLLNLRDDDKSTMRRLLSNLFDLIINSDIRQAIINKIRSGTFLLVDNLILNSKIITNIIYQSFPQIERNRIISWPEINTTNSNSILILSYQDQGKYPYYFYPNIIESTVSKSIHIEAVFHNFLFSNQYKWAKYNSLKEIYELTNHPIRLKYFHWNKLKSSIGSLRPQNKGDINWDLEQQYFGSSNRETIKLKLKKEKEKTFYSSELFIYNSADDLSYKVEKIGDIINNINKKDKYFIQNLDSIQEDINIYEKIIDTKQQKEELSIIRQQFNINNESTGRLWKILLKKRALSFGEEALYENLRKHLESKRIKIVSFHYFKHHWINPESDSIAPINKKVFIELCDFLELPKVYFRLIQRLRNTSKQSTRQSTRQMNRLLQDLFNNGCFDKDSNANEIISQSFSYYKTNYPLDDLGIDEKYLANNLVALVELIKPEINLKEIEKIKIYE